MFDILKNKKEPCKDCEKRAVAEKYVPMGDKYTLGQIREAFDRILRVSDQVLPQGIGHDYITIADRCTLSHEITKDALDVLVAIGVYVKTENGQYAIVSG